MNNLDNSPWAAFSSLHTLSFYNNHKLKNFASQLIESSNSKANAYRDIIAYIETLKEIKSNIEETFLDEQLL